MSRDSDISPSGCVFLIKATWNEICSQTLFSLHDHCCGTNLETSTKDKSSACALCEFSYASLLALAFSSNNGCWWGRENASRDADDNTDGDRKKDPGFLSKN